MKKILSFIVVVAAVAMVSCAGNTSKPAAEAEAPATEVVAPECDKNCETCEKADSCKVKCEEGQCCEKAAAEEAAPAAEAEK